MPIKMKAFMHPIKEPTLAKQLRRGATIQEKMLTNLEEDHLEVDGKKSKSQSQKRLQR